MKDSEYTGIKTEIIELSKLRIQIASLFLGLISTMIGYIYWSSKPLDYLSCDKLALGVSIVFLILALFVEKSLRSHLRRLTTYIYVYFENKEISKDYQFETSWKKFRERKRTWQYSIPTALLMCSSLVLGIYALWTYDKWNGLNIYKIITVLFSLLGICILWFPILFRQKSKKDEEILIELWKNIKEGNEKMEDNNKKDTSAKASMAYAKKRSCKWSKNPLVLLLIGSGLIWWMQQCILTKVNREEKKLDRKYEMLTNISSIHAEYYHQLWNYFFAKRDKENEENMRKYRGKIQLVVGRAIAIKTELPVLFKDKEILSNWDKFLEKYHNGWYKSSREGLTEQELNEILNSATPYIHKVIEGIYADLKVFDKEQTVKVSNSSQATGDLMQNRTICDISNTASAPIVTSETEKNKKNKK